MEYLKERQVLPNASVGFLPAQWQDDAGKRFWWLSGDQTAPANHQTPFDCFGITTPIPVSSGFTVSRVDYKVTVLNHCTWNGIMWPLGEFARAFEIFTPAPNGSVVTFFVGHSIQKDANGNPDIKVYWGGRLLVVGIDYTVNSANQSVTLLLPNGQVPPIAGDVLQSDYLTIAQNY